MRIYEADENTEGMKVLTFVSRLLPKAPGSLIYRCIRQKKIKVNKKRTEAGYRLKAGDAVSVWLDDERLRELSGEGDGAELSSASPADWNSHESEEEYSLYVRIYRDLKDRIPVISEDRDIIVFDKPAGLLSQSAVYGDENLNSFLIGLLLERGETGPELLRTVRPAVMSRLDRNTTGLVLCGKTISGEQYLARALRDRSLKKYWQYLVERIIRDDVPEEGINLCTYHSSKGREWQTVFLLENENSTICKTAQDMTVSRNAAYVACTRARRNLLISTETKTGYPCYFDFMKEKRRVWYQ